MFFFVMDVVSFYNGIGFVVLVMLFFDVFNGSCLGLKFICDIDRYICVF